MKASKIFVVFAFLKEVNLFIKLICVSAAGSIFDPLPRDVIPASVYMQWNSTPGRLYLMGVRYATPKLIVIYGLAVQSSLKSPRYATSVRSTVTHYIYFKWGVPGVAHKQSDRQAESAIGRYKLICRRIYRKASNNGGGPVITGRGLVVGNGEGDANTTCTMSMYCAVYKHGLEGARVLFMKSVRFSLIKSSWIGPNTWFERISILVILLNCVTLGMYQPCVDDNCETPRCRILQVSVWQQGLRVVCGIYPLVPAQCFISGLWRYHLRVLRHGDDNQDDRHGNLREEHVPGRLVESFGLLHRAGGSPGILSASGEP